MWPFKSRARRASEGRLGPSLIDEARRHPPRPEKPRAWPRLRQGEFCAGLLIREIDELKRLQAADTAASNDYLPWDNVLIAHLSGPMGRVIPSDPVS